MTQKPEFSDIINIFQDESIIKEFTYKVKGKVKVKDDNSDLLKRINLSIEPILNIYTKQTKYIFCTVTLEQKYINFSKDMSVFDIHILYDKSTNKIIRVFLPLFRFNENATITLNSNQKENLYNSIINSKLNSKLIESFKSFSLSKSYENNIICILLNITQEINFIIDNKNIYWKRPTHIDIISCIYLSNFNYYGNKSHNFQDNDSLYLRYNNVLINSPTSESEFIMSASNIKLDALNCNLLCSTTDEIVKISTKIATKKAKEIKAYSKDNRTLKDIENNLLTGIIAENIVYKYLSEQDYDIRFNNLFPGDDKGSDIILYNNFDKIIIDVKSTMNSYLKISKIRRITKYYAIVQFIDNTINFLGFINKNDFWEHIDLENIILNGTDFKQIKLNKLNYINIC